MIEACKDDVFRPKNEALCSRLYSTRSQHRLSWERAADLIVVYSYVNLFHANHMLEMLHKY